MFARSVWKRSALLTFAACTVFSCGKATGDSEESGGTAGDMSGPWGGSPAVNGGFGGGSPEGGTWGNGANGGNGVGGYGGGVGNVGGSGVAGSGVAGTGSGSGGTSWGGVGGVAGSVSVVGEGFVVHRIELGDRDPNGDPNSSAWKYLGADIDGLSSDGNSTNHCQLLPGANPSAVKTDGLGGIDNSFGANIMQLLLALQPTLSDDLQYSIDRGRSLAIVLSPHLTGSDVAGSIGRAHTRGTGYQLSEPWWAYENGYPNGVPRCELMGGTFQGELELSGSGFWELHLPIVDTDLIVKVRKTRLIADIDPATEQLSNVMLAGVIRTEELIESFRQAAGGFDLALCDGSTFDSIAAQIRAAADIRDDGQNGDPSVPCNAISIGIAVELDPMLFFGYDGGDDQKITCF
ncbi:MAG: hypothetical protein H6718_07270 [Polyangiaceae bacterium]|nr:hypothetical protein [Myxococcales bacterium]MCB9585181.1 hypothetical protein [Polyangiaceae bacterium]